MAHALKIGMPRLLTDSEYLYEVAAPNDAEHRFAVAGINRMAQEGERAEVAVAVLGSWFAPVPKATFVWDGNVGSPVTIKWEYPAAARLKGFRIYQGDRLLADESALKADAREFDCGKRTEFYGNRYFVEAVSNYGPTSKRVVVDRDLTDFPKDIYPPRPTDITAEWVKGGDRSNVLLKWTAPPRAERLVKGYIVFVDEDEVDGSMKQLPDTLVKGTQFTYTPPREGRSYRFFVESVTPAGTRSASASPVLLLAPGAVLPPATLMRPDSAVVDDDVELAWQYPPMPNLKGFRIYLDGQLLADEKTLDARARKHSFTLKKPGKFGLQIEAVPVEGPVSERGPSQPLRVAK
jgi:hypothetical protein